MSEKKLTPQQQKIKDDAFRKEVETKASELGSQLGVTVHPFVFTDPNQEDFKVVGYIREPARIVKVRVMDKAIIAPFTAATELMEACLIKEASDPRILSEAPENDKIYLGAAQFAQGLISFYQDQFKKK